MATEKDNTGGSSEHYTALLPILEHGTEKPASTSTGTLSYIHSEAFRTKCYWITLYFALNLLLTLHNKFTLNQFPFPYTMTALHALCNCIGTTTMWMNGSYTPIRISRSDITAVLLFSVLFAVNIAISNASLNLVTVPVHQIVRSSTPVMIVLLSILFMRKHYKYETYFVLFVISAGIGLATFGEYKYTAYGLFLTLFGALLSAVKTLVTSSMLKTSTKLGPLDLIFYMSPLAVIYMTAAAIATNELTLMSFEYTKMTNLALNGTIAFALNVVSFNANKSTGALAISVAANIKQVMTIVLAIVLFSLKITPLNTAGIMITLAGGMWYAGIEMKQQH